MPPRPTNNPAIDPEAQRQHPIGDCSSETMVRGGPRVAKADALDALHRAQASIRTLFEISRELVVVCRDGHILYANPAIARALGVRSDEIVEAPWNSAPSVTSRATISTASAPSKSTCATTASVVL